MGIVKDLPDTEKPREKALRYGVRILSNRELLAVLLRSGSQGLSALDTADRLLFQSKGLSGLARMSLPELMQVRGIKEVKALQLQACLELSRRIACEDIRQQDVIENPEGMVRWLQQEIGNCLQEEFLAVYLDSAHHIQSHRILFVGTLNMSLVYPREVFREALLLSSAKIMLVHNHPSGVLTPSGADLALTRRMMQIGRLMDISIMDHLIVSESDCFSFRKAGILDERTMAEDDFGC